MFRIPYPDIDFHTGRMEEKEMTTTLHHQPVRKKYRHTMTMDGVTVHIQQHQTTITGPNLIASVVEEKLPGWLADGMIEGTPTGGYKKGPAYQ
jgi:hypothetical protein